MIMEQIFQEVLMKHMRNRDMVGYSQHGLIKGKSCLTNLAAFDDGVTASVNTGKAIGVFYLDFL